MINLLPIEQKEDISYARRNTKLRKWVVFSLFSLVGVGLIVAGGLLYIQQAINANKASLAASQQVLESQKVGETQKKVEEISTNTKLATQVLSREILFSKLLKQIGSALPSNTVLQSLQIDKVQGGIQLNASAADFNAGTQIQLNLQDPKNGVFEKADINSITCGGDTKTENSTGTAKPKLYPCDVNLRALFGKNTSYYYISAGGAKQ